MGIINILKYIICGIAIIIPLFLIIYYIIWFIVNIVEQIKNVD